MSTLKLITKYNTKYNCRLSKLEREIDVGEFKEASDQKILESHYTTQHRVYLVSPSTPVIRYGDYVIDLSA